MEALEHQGYSKEKLQVLNRCRIYLQVMTVSDIMNGYGNGFTSMFKCRKTHQKLKNYKWPFQPEPTPSMKKLWSKALRKTFGLKAGKTTHQLGLWLHSNISLWIWFFHPTSSSLFQRFGAVWKVWKRDSNRGRLGVTSKFKYFTQSTRLPPSSCRSTVTYWSHDRVQCTGNSKHYSNTTTTYKNNIISTHFPLEISGDNPDDPHLIESIRQGNVKVVSDGSFLCEDSVGAAGWVIETNDEQVQLCGSMGTTGASSIQSAFRSELSGILYALLHLQQLCLHGNIT